MPEMQHCVEVYHPAVAPRKRGKWVPVALCVDPGDAAYLAFTYDPRAAKTARVVDLGPRDEVERRPVTPIAYDYGVVFDAIGDGDLTHEQLNEARLALQRMFDRATGARAE